MNLNKRFAFIINFLYFGLIFLIAYAALKYGLPMVMPFALGFALAYLLQKPALWLSSHLPVSRKTAALFTVLLFYCTAGLLITLASFRLVAVCKGLVLRIPELYELHIAPAIANLFAFVETHIQSLDPELETSLSDLFSQTLNSLGEAVSGLSVSAMGAISGSAASLPSFFIKIILLIISSLFIAADYEELTGFCMRQLGDRSKQLLMQIKEYVIGTLFVCIRSYAIIMSITFAELSVGFAFIGISNSVLIAFLIAIFDVLPVLGTGGIMLPWVVISAVQGNLGRALSLLVLYLAVTVIRNIIEPKIVGSQIGLHPVVTLVSMFVGVQMFGVLGLFGFPIGLSLLRHLNETGAIHILK
jgi:sporulation integral membrane protein YtvI